MKTVSRAPLREAVCDQLTEAIVRGELEAGQRIRLIPTAKKLGVSMTPLRESLVQLERDGLVEALPRRGYAVRPLTAWEVEEIYPLIWSLEALALRLAPPSGDALDRLDRINADFRRSRTDTAAQTRDRTWHRELIGACENAALQTFLESLKRRADRYERWGFSVLTVDVEPSAILHDRIVEALRAGSVSDATTLLEENWRMTPALLLPLLRESRDA